MKKGIQVLTNLKVEVVLLIQCTSAFTVTFVVKPIQQLKLWKEWLGSPLGIFDTAKNLSPKAEIWTSEKLPFLKTDDCVSESFEDSGIAERLTALLENLDNR